MRHIIKKILTEDLDSDELNWIREVDPKDNFNKWVSERRSHYGFNDEGDLYWFEVIENTKVFMHELTDNTHTLLDYVEDMSKSTDIKQSKVLLGEIGEMLGGGDDQSDNYYIEQFQNGKTWLSEFLKNFGGYGEKYNINLEHLLDLSHEYFDDLIDFGLMNNDN
jgi:phage anti-repressor protein